MELQADSEGDVVMRDGSSLAREVFAILELLEAILAPLPPRDLLFAQRVATNWRDAVRGSNVLRRVLFLEPSKEPEIVAVIKGMSRRDQRQVSRRALEDNIYFESAPARAEFSKFVPLDKLKEDQYYCRVVTLNPLLCTAQILHERCKTLPVDPIIKLQPQEEEGGRGGKEVLHAIHGPGKLDISSCTRMFLTQPPLNNLDFQLWGPAKNAIPFNHFFPNADCHGDRVTRTRCCGVICCRDCIERVRRRNRHAGRRCPLCGNRFALADGMTSEPFTHAGEGIRLMDLLNAVAPEWARKQDGEPLYGSDVRQAMVGLYFKKSHTKDALCVGTLVLHPDEWVDAQKQAAKCNH